MTSLQWRTRLVRTALFQRVNQLSSPKENNMSIGCWPRGAGDSGLFNLWCFTQECLQKSPCEPASLCTYMWCPQYKWQHTGTFNDSLKEHAPGSGDLHDMCSPHCHRWSKKTRHSKSDSWCNFLKYQNRTHGNMTPFPCSPALSQFKPVLYRTKCSYYGSYYFFTGVSKEGSSLWDLKHLWRIFNYCQYHSECSKNL